ncbi:hypothetical protein HG535_0G05650 [Zygotorulaspora mrakii]|uniref:Uncharacterized protein n=1 Tax=Zygotorulaspora mrakii TaxID=42260 RepID=A0A7H9AZJ7_ZYGMR|nr:uncharacterized protein HG535_0B07020 [Zygotorulaspora mrakii]XP_037146407.1 uncharacterized protein HG535_0G05650 [Zygotorulaspora mrakii]QLG71656.1 hypothetical protein HG535_0B07020 [Zygotorulaspora mrakii]QLG74682.1 hypothetical protein HG535_0G05650 [Zygotorulaspora mrakii]
MGAYSYMRHQLVPEDTFNKSVLLSGLVFGVVLDSLGLSGRTSNSTSLCLFSAASFILRGAQNSMGWPENIRKEATDNDAFIRSWIPPHQNRFRGDHVICNPSIQLFCVLSNPVNFDQLCVWQMIHFSSILANSLRHILSLFTSGCLGKNERRHCQFIYCRNVDKGVQITDNLKLPNPLNSFFAHIVDFHS